MKTNEPKPKLEKSAKIILGVFAIGAILYVVIYLFFG